MLEVGLVLYALVGLVWTLVDWREFFQRPTLYDLVRIIAAMLWWPLSMIQEFWWRPRQRRKREAHTKLER